MKQEVWTITAGIRMVMDVAFDHPISKKEAEDLFLNDIYEDIIEEEILAVEEVYIVE